MAIKFNRSQTFATNGTVTAAGLHNLIDGTDIYQALITDQTNLTSVGSADELLIADADLTANDAPRAVTVNELFEDALTISTYTNGKFTNLSFTNATGNSTVSTSATITTGTIPTLTAGTTISTAATITTGTVTNLNSTTGTIATLNSTTGTVTNLTSSTATITNLTTTLAGDFTITGGTGTIGTSTITPAKLSQPLTQGTSVASTSGTAIDFTGIPSWVKRITVMANGFSTNGSSNYIIQISSGAGALNTGYSSSCVYAGGTADVLGATQTGGFLFANAVVATTALYGTITLNLFSGNTWIATGIAAYNSTTPSAYVITSSGIRTLAGSLDRVRITTVNGTDTFDAGSVNIMYEG